VVSSKNIDGVVPLIRFLQQNFDIDSFGPNPIRGNPKDSTMLSPTAQQWLNLFKELSIYYKYFMAKKYKSPIQRYITYAQRKYLDKITALVLNEKPLPFSCKAGDTLAVLEPNGDVRLCELTACIGNLRTVDYDFKRIWFSAQAQAIRKQIKNCACTHGCFLSPSIALNPYHLLRSLIAI